MPGMNLSCILSVHKSDFFLCQPDLFRQCSIFLKKEEEEEEEEGQHSGAAVSIATSQLHDPWFNPERCL